MTFRTEEKIIINNKQLHDFRKWMNFHCASTIYPARIENPNPITIPAITNRFAKVLNFLL